MEEDLIIAKGFDRDIDYKSMKDRLIHEFDSLFPRIATANTDYKYAMLIHKLIYLMISMIQLRNGSRVSEAIAAFRAYLRSADDIDRVIVKIAKSDGIKYDKIKKEKKRAKARYRKIMFPDKWVSRDILTEIKSRDETKEWIKSSRLRKRVLDYLLKNFECNTHSLRYAFINFMLYEEKRPMNDVAKFVGHVDVSMLVRYTQVKNTEQIFDLDI
jgi:integrase